MLDEAQVYDGVFGSNMAHLLRRQSAVAAPHAVVVSTATIGDTARFMWDLTGREMEILGPGSDGSGSPTKTVIRLVPPSARAFENAVAFLRMLSAEDARFLAFGDSRRSVELVVSAALRARKGAAAREGVEEDDDIDDAEVVGDRGGDEGSGPVRPFRESLPRVLPYRAGYETRDRDAIQAALTRGSLAGVVSTSALELGIDIGDIDTVVLLNPPPTVKSFWQRIGRAGRRREATCFVVDGRQAFGRLADDGQRPPEPSWLYLDNRYIQYGHALCAAAELPASGKAPGDVPAFRTAPGQFTRLVDNELNPSDLVASDLYPLKQRAQGGPHREFPLRSATEQDFRVSDVRGLPLGTLSCAQALREAYPGAVYYDMARPHRVYAFGFRNSEIKVKRAKRWTTQPLSTAMVFPRFETGVLTLFRNGNGFVAEAELQVSERVTGFSEQRGRTKTRHDYGPDSEFSQKPLTRFFQTTGVCWHFGPTLILREASVALIVEAFCAEFSIQPRDLGIGTFRSRTSPLGTGPVQGFCIYDATNGSLRLTERLAERFSDVLASASRLADAREWPQESGEIDLLIQLASRIAACAAPESPEPAVSGTDCVPAILLGQRVIYRAQDGPQEVRVIGCRYTPQGLLYQLESPTPGLRWMVAASAMEPLNGDTEMGVYNLMTGEYEPGLASPAIETGANVGSPESEGSDATELPGIGIGVGRDYRLAGFLRTGL